jgi:hypothetical protein
LVVDVLDAGDRVERVFGHPLGLAALDCPGQGNLAVLDLDLNVLGVELPVLGQALADVFFDALVVALITTRAPATIRAWDKPDLFVVEGSATGTPLAAITLAAQALL